jgi:hypothetical protein
MKVTLSCPRTTEADPLLCEVIEAVQFAAAESDEESSTAEGSEK